MPDVFILFHQWAIYSNRMWNLVNFLVQIIWHYLFTGKSLYLQDQNIFYSIEIYRPCIYRKIPVNTGKMCFIAFVLKTTGSCKIFLYLQDPVITEPCIFIALGSGIRDRHFPSLDKIPLFFRKCQSLLKLKQKIN